MSSQSPVAKSRLGTPHTTFRKRRLLWTVLAILGFFSVCLLIPLPEGLSNVSRASVAYLTKESEVGEVWGLLRMVTQGDVVLSDGELVHSKRISMKTYAGGEKGVQWVIEEERMKKETPVVVFSKVRDVVASCRPNRRFTLLVRRRPPSCAPR